jgi:drug/metabolite transporter (DMT)-like permease
MIFLVLTILSSVLTSVVLKINEGRGGNRLVVAGTNYVVAAALAFAMTGPGRLAIGPMWTAIAVVTGVGFIGGFLVMMKGLKEIGLAIPTSAARLSMLIPVTGSIAFFGERPSGLQIAGIAAGMAAFVLLGAAQRSRGPAMRRTAAPGPEPHPDGAPEAASGAGRIDLKAIGLLVAMFAIIGSTDFTMKISQSAGVDKDAMAFYIFCSAALCCWVPIALRRVRVTGAAIATGALLGVPNYFSVYFLLVALRALDASVVFPVVSAGAVVAVTAVAVMFWKEQPNRTAWMGIALAALAVALLGFNQGGS